MSTDARLALDVDLVDPVDAREVAKMYLPDSQPGNRWALETFTWIPSDETLADLPWPLVPDSDALIPNGISEGTLIGGPTAYYAQTVLAEIPPALNPGSQLGYLAGCLTGVTIRIKRRRISIDVQLDRHLGTPIDGSGMGASYDDIATNFPTVTYDDVDPNVTYYDARIAHP